MLAGFRPFARVNGSLCRRVNFRTIVSCEESRILTVVDDDGQKVRRLEKNASFGRETSLSRRSIGSKVRSCGRTS